jgi:hypothetical protein
MAELVKEEKIEWQSVAEVCDVVAVERPHRCLSKKCYAAFSKKPIISWRAIS